MSSTTAVVAKKGKGKGAKPKAEKHRKARTGVKLIVDNDVKRLALRAGVKRASSATVPAVRLKARELIRRLMAAAAPSVELDKRRTIQVGDVILAYKVVSGGKAVFYERTQ
jgi:histone H3/H4